MTKGEYTAPQKTEDDVSTFHLATMRELLGNAERHDTGTCSCQYCEKIRLIAGRMFGKMLDVMEAAHELQATLRNPEMKLRTAIGRIRQY